MIRKYARDNETAFLLSLQRFCSSVAFSIDELTVIVAGQQYYSGPKEDFFLGADTPNDRSAKEIVDDPRDSKKPYDNLNGLVFLPARSDEQLRNKLAKLKDLETRTRTQIRTRADELGPSSSSSKAAATARGPARTTPFKAAPWYFATWTLLKIQLLDDIRHRSSIVALMTTYFLVYLLVAFIFFQLPPDTPEGLVDRTGLFFFLNVNSLFSNTLSILTRFDYAEAHLRHEREYRILNSHSIILSQYLSALPLRLFLVILLATPIYYIVGLRTDGFQYYLVFICDLLLMALASVALGILVAVCMVRLEYGQILLPFFGVLILLFGNLSTAPDVTWILLWLQYLSIIYYSFQCLMQNELDGIDQDKQDFLEQGNFNSMPIAACLPALFGFALVFLLLAMLIHHLRWRGRVKK